eukprot:11581168-Heterocapsa_arctica.AAC.1
MVRCIVYAYCPLRQPIRAPVLWSFSGMLLGAPTPDCPSARSPASLRLVRVPDVWTPRTCAWSY